MMVRIRFKLNLLALTLLIVGIDSSSSSSSGNLRTASPRRLRQRRDAMIQDRIIGGNVVKTPYPFFGLWIVGCGASLIHDDSKFRFYIVVLLYCCTVILGWRGLSVFLSP